MADKKISQLPAATLPLAGTELLPIVQSGTTDNITVNNLAVGNIKSNATTGVLQVTGPAAAATRVMTTPDANFTVARTDAGQTFTGTQTFGAVTVSAGATDVATTVSGSGTPTIRIANTRNDSAWGSGQEYGALTFYTSDSSGIGAHTTASISVEDRNVGGGQFTPQGNLLFKTALYSATPTNVMRLNGDSKDVEVLAGNVVIGTSGKGIDFSATASGSGTMTSELLADYEEGTFTVTLSPGTSGTITINSSYDTLAYTKVGRLVTISGQVRTNSVSSPVGTFWRMSGLPFACAALTERAGFSAPIAITDFGGVTTLVGGSISDPNTFINFYSNAASIAGGNEINLSFSYIAA